MARNMIDRAKTALTGRQTIADEIAGLETTKAALEKRVPDLEAAKAAALDRRREALIGDPTGSEASAAAVAAREAEGDLAAVADALEEVGRRLEAARQRQENERAKAEREEAAGRLDREANQIEAAMMAVGEATSALAAAHERLGFTITPQAAPIMSETRPGRIADIIVLRALAAALPTIEIRSELTSYSPFATLVEGEAAAVAAPAMAGRLRAAATEIREGGRGSDLPEHHDEEKTFSPQLPEVLVYVTTPFKYDDKTPQMVGRQHKNLPQAIAYRAIDKGLASIEKPAGWSDTAGALDIAHNTGLWATDCVDLGFDFAAWKNADVERQRGEWREAQDARRAAVAGRAA